MKVKVQPTQRHVLLRNALLWWAMVILAPCVTFSQDLTRVTGRVTSVEDGQSIPGVNVLIKGTTTGAVTDINGNYSVEAPGDGTLIFSFIGYQREEVPVNSRTVINVSLQAEALSLEEVVVTGYSTQRKKDITGSVGIVDMDALKSIPAGSAAQSLQGQAAGVTVITSGMAGYRPAIRVRGISTFGDSYPLVLIDGVEASLNDISASDIESIQVLRDAGASAIYGVRGANGVIVVTTRKGKSGAPVMTYEGYYGVTYPLSGSPLNLMSSEEFMNAQLIADPNHPLFQNGMPDFMYVSPDGVGVAMAGDPLVDPSNYHFDPDPLKSYLIQEVNKVGTNWYQETSQNAPRMSHNLSLSGGNDKSTYLMSLGYYSEDGTLIKTHLKRYSARVNTEFQPKDNIRVGENLNVFFRDNPVVPILGSAGQFSPLGLHRDLLPIIPVYDIMGNWGGTRIGPNLGTQRNPVQHHANMEHNRNYSWNVVGNMYAELDFLKYFTVRSSIGGALENYRAQSLYRTEYNRSEFFSNPNRFSESSGYNNRIVWTNTVRFGNTYGKHNISVLAGLEAIRNYGRSLGGSREGYILEEFDYLTLSSGTSNITNYSNHYEDRLYSQFGNVNYAYDDKYLVGVTLRRDGSSKFGVDSRYGLFPSFSLGWRMSQERFMKNLAWLDDLKIRGSYGVLGSQNNVDPENQFDLFNSSFIASYYDINGTSNSVVQGFYQSRMGNTATGWEENIVTNVGIDISVFKIATFNLDVYRKSIDGLIFPMPLPATVGGAAKPAVNIGDIQNTGIDFSATLHGQVSELQYNVTANIGAYKNEVVDVPGPGYFDGGSGTRNQEGHPIGSFFGYDIVGMFQSDDDVNASPTQDGAAPGRFKYRDVNSDGAITPDDRTFIGDPNPDFVYGLNVGLGYKGFDLSANFYGSQGNDIYNTLMEYTHTFGGYESNKSRDLLNAWTAENTDTMVPRIEESGSFSTFSAMNSYRIKDGSFLRMRSLIIGYSLPAAVVERIGVTRLRVYTQGTNLFTVTDYNGYDPEIGGSSAVFGVDVGPYPAGQKSFLVGASVTF
jgi:TonB-linked SusC/RagA family outer membrane protein